MYVVCKRMFRIDMDQNFVLPQLLLFFRWLGVVIYWMYLFLVSIILLNMLIAQFTHTYDEEFEKARVSVTLHRAIVLYRIETSLIVKGLYKLILYVCKKKVPPLVRDIGLLHTVYSQLFHHEGFKNLLLPKIIVVFV